MATTAPKRKVKHAGSRPNHPAASKQRIFAAATPPPLTRAERLKVVDPTGPRTPPDALLRLEALERRLAELTAKHERAVGRIDQLEAQLGAEADAADAYVAASVSGHARFVAETSGAGDEPAAEPSVDPMAEDLGGESA